MKISGVSIKRARLRKTAAGSSSAPARDHARGRGPRRRHDGPGACLREQGAEVTIEGSVMSQARRRPDGGGGRRNVNRALTVENSSSSRGPPPRPRRRRSAIRLEEHGQATIANRPSWTDRRRQYGGGIFNAAPRLMQGTPSMRTRPRSAAASTTMGSQTLTEGAIADNSASRKWRRTGLRRNDQSHRDDRVRQYGREGNGGGLGLSERGRRSPTSGGRQFGGGRSGRRDRRVGRAHAEEQRESITTTPQVLVVACTSAPLQARRADLEGSTWAPTTAPRRRGRVLSMKSTLR